MKFPTKSGEIQGPKKPLSTTRKRDFQGKNNEIRDTKNLKHAIDAASSKEDDAAFAACNNSR
jgi:hypothetical protein